jgi:hypothetical protein
MPVVYEEFPKREVSLEEDLERRKRDKKRDILGAGV